MCFFLAWLFFGSRSRWLEDLLSGIGAFFDIFRGGESNIGIEDAEVDLDPDSCHAVDTRFM